MSSLQENLSIVDPQQLQDEDGKIRDEIEKTQKIMRRAFFCFLFTISLFVMFDEGILGINIPNKASINAAIMKQGSMMAQGQINLITSGDKLALDAEAMLDILNAARENAKKLTVTMWGYTHTPQEWLVILRRVSPEYLGPVLDVITKILEIFYNLGSASSLILKDSYGVVAELSQGNMPLMELARLQGYTNLFSAMTPFITGLGLGYGSTNAAYKTVVGESILQTVTRISSSVTTACANTTMSLLDMCLAVVLDTSGINGIGGEDMQGSYDSQGSQSSLGFSQPLTEYSTGSDSSMFGDVDGISKLANALAKKFNRDEISLEVSRISKRSSESIETFITAQTNANRVIENPKQGNESLSQQIATLFNKTRENVLSVLNYSSETLGEALNILFHSNTNCPDESTNEDSQSSAISALTSDATCDPLISLVSVAEGSTIDGAINLVKENDVREKRQPAKKRRYGGTKRKLRKKRCKTTRKRKGSKKKAHKRRHK